jgi:hypothetical protein
MTTPQTIKVGDVIERNGTSYKVEQIGKTQRILDKNGIVGFALLRPESGNARFMAWIWDGGEVGPPFEIA